MQSLSKHLVTLLLCTAFIGSATYAANDDNIEAYTPQELQQLLAPIALYPDTVLTHILIAATYPLEVIQADRWKQSHPNITDEAAVNAGTNEGWDPSVTALLAFPDLLSQMSEDIAWTRDLGEAFLYSESDVLSAIQALRQQAYDSGSLTDLEHLEVSQEGGDIIIAPIRREIVYIPYYDSRRVYGDWRWSSHPPVYWSHAYSNHYDRHGFYWGIHAPVSSWFYFGGFHWGQRNIVVINNRHIHHNRGRHYSGHQLYTHHNASRWQHQPTHRRGVRYLDRRAHRNWSSQLNVTRGSHRRHDTRENHTRRTTGNADIARELRNPRDNTHGNRDEHRTRDRSSREYSTHSRSGPNWRTGSPTERNNSHSTRERRNTETATRSTRSDASEIRNPSTRERTTTTTTRTRTVEPVLNERIRQSTTTVRRDDRTSSRNIRSSTRGSRSTHTRQSRTRER